MTTFPKSQVEDVDLCTHFLSYKSKSLNCAHIFKVINCYKAARSCDGLNVWEILCLASSQSMCSGLKYDPDATCSFLNIHKFIRCVCVRTRADGHVCLHAHACLHVLVCRDQELKSGVFLNLFSLSFWAGSHDEPRKPSYCS